MKLKIFHFCMLVVKISADLDKQLLDVGYNVKRIINYRVNHNQKINENFIKELEKNVPDMIYIYSQKALLVF